MTEVTKKPTKMLTRKTVKGDDKGKLEDEKYEKVRKSRFKQQRLPAWRPVPTIGSIIAVFSIFGAVFVILGIILLVFSSKVKSISKRYDDICPNVGTECSLSFNIEHDMDEPIMIYYQLEGFYQNSRRYVKSKSINQLKGENVKGKDLEDECDPVYTNSEMALNSSISISGNPLVGNEAAIPCGLMAKTFFNDSYINWKVNNAPFDVDESNIAFAKDKKIFNNPGDQSKAWLDLTNEHFLVWMRPSGLPNFKKLWGRIRQDLKKGDKLELTVKNNYDVSIYQGKKNLILSTSTVFGGKNKFLGLSYIIVGVISIILAIVFPIYYGIQQRKERVA